MPKVRAIDVSVRPIPPEIAPRLKALEEYRHIWQHTFKRPEVLESGISDQSMKEEMDRHNIGVALVSGYDARKSSGLYIDNDWVGQFAARNPGRVIGGIAIDPLADISKSLEEIDRCVATYGFKFVKIFPYACDLPPTDRRFYPIFAKCVERQLVVWTQVGHTGGLMPSEPGRPIYLDRVALDFPQLQIIGGHIGWPWEQEMIALAVKHPNVYLSTCAHAPDHWPDSVVHFLKTRGKRKTIFGTNWPYISYDRYFQFFSKLGLDDETESLFLRDNLARILRL